MHVSTRVLMSSSAGIMAALGVGLTFLPQEALTHLGARPDSVVVVLVQMLGASFIAFAGLNWMARGHLIGGIYGRPIGMANFFHFAIGAATLLKAVPTDRFDSDIVVGAAIYSVFALWFGIVLFTHPGTAAPR